MLRTILGFHIPSILIVWLTILLPRPTHTCAAEMLTAHIIAHSHCDPGWLSTFENYYTSDVNRIISAATDQLLGDPNKRFVWAEISFFSRWYEDQSLERKRQFRDLVHSGRWEFVGGGWAQNDEAASDLMLVVNQMTTGHQYLLENFGVQPRIGWQIDPFGHSSITPSLFKKMGFDALVINRIHHQKKGEYKAGRLMEFMWRGASAGGDTDMFTHVLHTHYSAPKGFDWEEGAPQINNNNVESRANMLTNELKRRRNSYKSPHLLVPFGDDFKFKNAANQFQNMEALIKHVNANSQRFGVTLRFSTLSEYFRSVHDWAVEKGEDFPLFMGDFFPYADNEDSYWTGYYTTRPFLKKLSRQVEASMRAAEALYAIARANINANNNPAPAGLVNPSAAAAHWMQTFEHIKTARTEALNTASGIIESYLSIMLTKDPSNPAKLTHAARVLERGKTVHAIIVYNSLSWQRSEVISVHVDSPHVYVANSEGAATMSQVDRHWTGAQDPSPSSSEYILRFFAQVPPLGASVFYVHVRSSPADAPPGLTAATPSRVTEYIPGGGGGGGMLRGVDNNGGVQKGDLESAGSRGEIFIENEVYKVELSQHCLLRAMTDKRGEQQQRRVRIDQTLRRYRTHKSGAYIFRPVRPAEHVGASGSARCRVFRGNVVDVVTGVTGDLGFGVQMMLPKGGKVLNALALQQTLTVNVGLNEELVTYFETDIKNQREIATHNGLEFVPRRSLMAGKISKNFWPSVYGGRIAEPAGGGGYGFSILNSHSVGVGSQDEGHIEMMIHRQLNQDDGRGLSEAVRDASRPEVTLWFTLDKVPLSKELFELHQLRLNNPPHVLFTAAADATASNEEALLSQFAPLKTELPAHIHIMSLMVRDGATDEVVLRLRSLSPSAPEFRLPFDDSDKRLFETLSIDQVTQSTLSSTHQGERFLDALSFRVSTQTVDEATKRLDKMQMDRQASQNTEEEGVFLSKSALERSRKLLSLPAPSVVIRPGDIKTLTVVLRDALGEKEREDWLEGVKKQFPDYAKALAKPQTVSFVPSDFSHINNNNNNNNNHPQPGPPHPPPIAIPPQPRPPVHPASNQPAQNLALQQQATTAQHLPPFPPEAKGGKEARQSEEVSNDMLEQLEKDSAGYIPNGFEYGFVMGAASVAGLCFLLHLNVLSCNSNNTKKQR